MACFDTSCLLDLLGRGGRALQQRARRLIDSIGARDDLCTTRLNVAELWVGVHRADDARDEQRRVVRLLRDFEVLELTAGGARSYGAITAYLRKRGRPIGNMDALIAAVAIAYGQPLVTRDVDHFRAVPGLEIVEY